MRSFASPLPPMLVAVTLYPRSRGQINLRRWRSFIWGFVATHPQVEGEVVLGQRLLESVFQYSLLALSIMIENVRAHAVKLCLGILPQLTGLTVCVPRGSWPQTVLSSSGEARGTRVPRYCEA